MKFGKLLKVFITTIMFLAITVQWYNAYTSASGPDPGNTGAPGENDCTSCHSGSANTSSSTIKLKTHQSSTTLDYLPDSTYTITIDLNTSNKRNGFQVTALYGTSNKMAGAFTITDKTNTKKTSTIISSNTREYVEQTYSGTSANSWSFEWKAPSTNVGDITFYVAANLSNNDGYNSSDAIHTKSFTFSPSAKLPTAAISVASTAVCQNDSFQFNGSGTNSASSYKWTFTNASPSTSTLQNPKVKSTSTNGILGKLVVTNGYGASAEVSRSITVRALPADTIAVTGPRTVCEGDSIRLNAANGSKYEWSTGETTQTIYAKKAGNYTVKVTNGFGCPVTSKPFKAVFLAKPTIVFDLKKVSDTICKGDSLIFGASAGGGTYNFYDGNNIVQSSTSTDFVAKNLTVGKHTFYVLATNSNGCISDTPVNKYTTVVIDRLAAPTVNCGTSTTSSVTFNWNNITGAKGYEVSTDGGTNWASVSTNSYTKSGLNSNENVTAMVRATDNTACKFGQTATATCKTLPCSELTYTVTYDSTLCEGNQAVIRFGNFSSKTYAISLNGGNPTKDTIFTFAPTADSVITFNLVDSTKLNCAPIENPVRLYVDKTSEITVAADKNLYCKGEMVQLTATPGYNSYKFYKNNVLVQTQKAAVFMYSNVEDGDALYVVGSTVNGCEKTSETRSVAVATRTNPGFTFTSNKLEVTFTDTTALATQRTWNFGDGNTSTDQVPTHTFAAAGTYTVWLHTTNFQGCTDSVSKTLNVTNVGIQELTYLQEAQVYPNPFRAEINVLLFVKQASKVQLVLTDIKGRTVLNMPVQTKTGRNEIRVPANNLSGGIYMLRVQTGNETLIKKIIRSNEK
ncbi:MAG: T9SS type A sorting domain-containing protein [Sphingobacteriales bacterium]|nr:MAG: T9SS type A sorting domain-containing protein [Sphingobacteriales bacterium]